MQLHKAPAFVVYTTFLEIDDRFAFINILTASVHLRSCSTLSSPFWCCTTIKCKPFRIPTQSVWWLEILYIQRAPSDDKGAREFLPSFVQSKTKCQRRSRVVEQSKPVLSQCVNSSVKLSDRLYFHQPRWRIYGTVFTAEDRRTNHYVTANQIWVFGHMSSFRHF